MDAPNVLLDEAPSLPDLGHDRWGRGIALLDTGRMEQDGVSHHQPGVGSGQRGEVALVQKRTMLDGVDPGYDSEIDARSAMGV